MFLMWKDNIDSKSSYMSQINYCSLYKYLIIFNVVYLYSCIQSFPSSFPFYSFIQSRIDTYDKINILLE